MPFPTFDSLLIEEQPSVVAGANQRRSALDLQPNEVADCLNIEIETDGRWRRRKGVATRGGRPDAPGGLTWARGLDNDVSIYGVFGSSVYRSPNNEDWSVVASDVSLYSNTLHQFVQGFYSPGSGFLPNADRAIYVCQCVQQSGATEASRLAVWRSDDVTADDQYTQVSNHSPRCIAHFQGRIWKGNDRSSGDGHDLGWSEIDDGLSYSTTNELSIEPGIGGEITGLLPAKESSPIIFIFKERALAFLSPKWGSSSALIPSPSDALDTVGSRLQVISTEFGCIATRSIKEVSGINSITALFLAHDGIRPLQRSNDGSLFGVGLPITDKVPGWMARVNWTHAHKAVATVYDNAYYLSLPLDGEIENSHTIRFDLQTGALALHNWRPRDITSLPVDEEDRLYLQYNDAFTEESTATGLPSSATYHVYNAYSTDTDPGATYVSYELQTRAFKFDNVRQEKRWDRVYFLGAAEANETHSMNVAYRVDFGNWVTAATALRFGSPGNTIVLGSTELVWDNPDRKLVGRRLGLSDVPPGVVIEFRFMGSSDEAQPSIYHFDATAWYFNEIFENTR